MNGRPVIVDNVNSKRLSTMTDENLIDERYSLEARKVELERQLSEATLRHHETGRYADARWYQTTKNEIRQAGLRIFAICSELSRRKKRAVRRQSVADHFVEVAREMLDRETFQTLLDEAHERRAQRKD